MKRIFGVTFGGLQQKVINLVLVIILAVIAIFSAVTIYQTRSLNKIMNDADVQQRETVERISGDTIHKFIEESMTRTGALQAYIADDMFSDLKNEVQLLKTLAKGLFEHKDSFEPYPFEAPDPEKDGEYSAHVLSEEGVDPDSSELIGVAAHMSDTMIAVCKNSNYIRNCFFGLVDGTVLVVDKYTKNKYDENGKLTSFPVRSRPWYTGAEQTGAVYFSGVEHDTYTSSIGVECSAPVYVEGELVGVVGADLFLDAMSEYVNNSSKTDLGFVFVISDKGQVIFAPKDNGIFTVETADTAEDLRESSNAELAQFVKDSLFGKTGLRKVNIDGSDYYMAGIPMNTVGWAVVTVAEKEATETTASEMLRELERISNAAGESYEKGVANSRRLTLIMIALILAAGLLASYFIANRLVKPIEKMTERAIAISGTDQVFEMEDDYRTKDEIETLAKAFAEMSEKTVKYFKDINEITKEKERISAELGLAQKIQADMLPNIYPAFPDRPEFDIYASMTPAKEVGGDFYDSFMIDDDHLGMVMADVSGKGVPAALFMMMSKIIIKNYAMMGSSPARVLSQTNETICMNNDEEMFVTVWFGILEISTGKITAANAGHEYPIIKRPGGAFELFKDKHGFVIGGMSGVKYKEYELTLEKGSTLFLYTDGVPEATDADNQLFGTDRLLTAMNSMTVNEPKDLLTGVRAAVNEFVGEAPQFDYLTMLAMTYLL